MAPFLGDGYAALSLGNVFTVFQVEKVDLFATVSQPYGPSVLDKKLAFPD